MYVLNSKNSVNRKVTSQTLLSQTKIFLPSNMPNGIRLNKAIQRFNMQIAFTALENGTEKNLRG